MWWRILVACSDNGLSYAKPVEVCGSERWPAEGATLEDVPGRWTASPLWEADVGGEVSEIAAAAFGDTDGDQQIRPGDRLDIVTLSDKTLPNGVRISQVHLVEAGVPRLLLDAEHAGWEPNDILLGEIDPSRPGPEILVLGDRKLALASREGVYLEVDLPREDASYNRLVDLEGDGLLELVGTRGVYELSTLEQRFAFPEELDDAAVAADLDGDGTAELIVHDPEANEAVLYSPAGDRLAACAMPLPAVRGSTWAFAVGELDGEPELEVVVGGAEGMMVCERDGTVLAHSTHPIDRSLALAQLDGDPEVEIVGQSGETLLGFQHDLSLPASGVPLLGSGTGFSVADLDQDGVHEVLSRTDAALVVYRATGTPVMYHPLQTAGTWMSGIRVSPMAADIDGDGLAELVTPDWGRGTLLALDSTLGGWEVEGASDAWTDSDYHPDWLLSDARVGALDPEAVATGHNVWNGRPAVPAQCASTIGVEIRDVCAGTCDGGEVFVTAYVSNAGVMPAGGLQAQLWIGGELLATTPVEEVPAEIAVPVELVAPADTLPGTLEVRLGGQSASCGAASATWDQPVCED
jgi:hypothetical protein